VLERYVLDGEAQLVVVVVSAKYEELSRFCPYINAEDAMVSKCVKFENGLKLEIYKYICFHEIRDFDTLVHKCRMFDDAGKARMSYYKARNDKKGKGHGFGKPYNKDKGKKKDVGGGSKPNVVEVKCSNFPLSWVIILVIVRKGKVATSVVRKVISLMSARGRSLVTTVVKRVI